MKKICLINCYFGNLPEYFELWKKSALANESVDFLLFTDCDVKSCKNIKVVKTTLHELKLLFEKKLGFTISLEKPYKLCDYKTSYGFMFDEYLNSYDFWGYCDIDLIFGNIRKFITDKLLDKYEIVLNLGHLTLFKNNEYNKKIFMLPGSIYNFKKVFKSKENYAFDEMSGLHRILKYNNITPFVNIPVADINRRFLSFQIEKGYNYNKQVFYYQNGGIFRRYIDDKTNKIETDEFIYLHFQKRKPKICIDLNANAFCIGPYGFTTIEDVNNFDSNKIDKKIDKQYLKNYKRSKIYEFLKRNLKSKIIWIKQKIAR